MHDQDRIRARAYAIWEREGRPHGRDEAHWEQARREIAQAGSADPSPAEAALPEEAATGTDESERKKPGRDARKGAVEEKPKKSGGKGRKADAEGEASDRKGGKASKAATRVEAPLAASVAAARPRKKRDA